VDDIRDDGGVVLQLAECTGAPAFTHDFYFEGVANEELQVTFDYRYSGNLGHNIKIRIYNFNTPGWEDLTANTKDFNDTGASYEIVSYPLPNPLTNYLSSGEIRLRI